MCCFIVNVYSVKSSLELMLYCFIMCWIKIKFSYLSYNWEVSSPCGIQYISKHPKTTFVYPSPVLPFVDHYVFTILIEKYMYGSNIFYLYNVIYNNKDILYNRYCSGLPYGTQLHVFYFHEICYNWSSKYFLVKNEILFEDPSCEL